MNKPQQLKNHSVEFTADEARNKANSSKRRLIEEELKNVFRLISKACYDGNFEIEWPDNLSDNALARLKELGKKLFIKNLLKTIK